MDDIQNKTLPGKGGVVWVASQTRSGSVLSTRAKGVEKHSFSCTKPLTRYKRFT
jgi:hypothetical protein